MYTSSACRQGGCKKHILKVPGKRDSLFGTLPRQESNIEVWSFICHDLHADEDLNYARQLLERLAKAESKGGEVRVIPKDSVPQSAVSSADDPGFRAIQQAALETIRGPEVSLRNRQQGSI